MGVQMRTKTEETAEPLIENNNKEDVEEPLKPQPPQKREILWATAIYLTTWHVLAVICTILYWKNVKMATILWSKCNIMIILFSNTYILYILLFFSLWLNIFYYASFKNIESGRIDSVVSFILLCN